MAICKDRGEYELSVTSERIKHAELFSAFEYGDILNYTLFVHEGDLPVGAFMLLTRDEDGEELTIPGFKQGDSYHFTLHLDEICKGSLSRGLFFCRFLLGDRTVSVNEYGKGFLVDSAKECGESFQLTVYKPGTNRPKGCEGGIIYQIFPDRFCKGDRSFSKEGAVLEDDWFSDVREFSAYPGAPLKNNHFFGGTLYGVADKLDYLKSLGVTMIYLCPVFRAASNHRYDTGDYAHVDELLGGDEALKELFDRAREKGIGVILDGVFNHTGADSLYFNKFGHYPTVGAYQSKESPYSDWFFFSDFPDKYESWWGIDILPKVNCRNDAFREFITGENGILARYLKMGAAGWRLDVADELPDVMLDAVHARVNENDRRAPVYGEVWEDASNKIAYSHRRHYFSGGQLDAVMNYPLKNAIIAFLTSGDATFLYGTMKALYRHYPKAASDLQMNLLGSHDTPRILNMLAGNPHEGMPNTELAHARLSGGERAVATERLRLALILQMLLPGIPCIYYGDEIGMEGDRDPFNRQTYKWGREDQNVLSFYREITSLRRSLPMLADAFYKGVSCSDGVFVFERFNDEHTLFAAVNASDRPCRLKIRGGRMLYPSQGFVCDEVTVDRRQACVILYD